MASAIAAPFPSINILPSRLQALPANQSSEERIALLESQLSALLKWQKHIDSVMNLAVSATNGGLSKTASHAETIEEPKPMSRSARNKLARKQAEDQKAMLEISPAVLKGAPLTPAATPPRQVSPSPEKQSAKKSKQTKQGSATPPIQQDTTSQAKEEAVTLPVAKVLSPPVIPLIAPRKETTAMAFKILDIIQHYGQNNTDPNETLDDNAWLGRAKFAPNVEGQVEAGQPIKMILPSFPWKSINRVDKVTGALPDLGEELSLARLNALCEDIKKIYLHGAEVTIATDGLVFNDVVGITDDDTWEYSVALMEMAKSKGFLNIKLVRVMDFLDVPIPSPLTKADYLSLVPLCRSVLSSQFARPMDSIREMMKSDNDTLLTYRGFIRFLETDLRFSPVAASATSGVSYRKIVKSVALEMMARAESFTKIILATCPQYVRLSIHPSSGKVKLSIPLIPQRDGTFPRSAWHCSVAVGVDGAYRTVHAKDVRDTHALMVKNGRPWCFRERNEVWDWVEGRAELEFGYPGGCTVRALKEGDGLADSERALIKRLAGLQRVRVEGWKNMKDGELSAEV